MHKWANNFSHCVHLIREHQFHALLKVCSDHGNIVPLNKGSIVNISKLPLHWYSTRACGVQKNKGMDMLHANTALHIMCVSSIIWLCLFGVLWNLKTKLIVPFINWNTSLTLSLCHRIYRFWSIYPAFILVIVCNQSYPVIEHSWIEIWVHMYLLSMFECFVGSKLETDYVME